MRDRLLVLALVLLLPGTPACDGDGGTDADADADADADGDADTDGDADADGDADTDGDADADADGDVDGDSDSGDCVDEPPPEARPFHVAPEGTSDGDGSVERPWDLATALSGPGSVTPGSTIWLHGGVYQGGFDAQLAGTEGARIVVTSAPSEWAVIDIGAGSGGSATFSGAWVTYRDFEVTDSDPDRWNDEGGSSFDRGAFNVFGEHLELVHLVVHDTSGCGFWTPALDLVLYGCLIYNNGWDAPDRAHGHGVYMQNLDGTKHIEENLIFNSFSYGVHAYTEGGSIQGFDLVGNAFWNAGAASPGADRYTVNCLIGGLQPADRIVLRENFGWFRDPDGRTVRLGYSDDVTNGTATLTGNVIVGSTAFAAPWSSIAMTGNTFYGAVEGIETTAYPDNAYASPPTEGASVFVRPSTHTPRRANVIVFNWGRTATVSADVTGALPRGATYEVRDAQDWSGAPVLAGVYDGTPLVLPMGRSPAQPIGAEGAIEASETSEPDFGAFVLLGGLCAE